MSCLSHRIAPKIKVQAQVPRAELPAYKQQFPIQPALRVAHRECWGCWFDIAGDGDRGSLHVFDMDTKMDEPPTKVNSNHILQYLDLALMAYIHVSQTSSP